VPLSIEVAARRPFHAFAAVSRDAAPLALDSNDLAAHRRHHTRSPPMHRFHRHRLAGQGMTEYIIIVALIAVAAIGVYTAFGDIVRGQTSVAAAALAGNDAGNGRGLVGNAEGRANNEGRQKTLENFEQ